MTTTNVIVPEGIDYTLLGRRPLLRDAAQAEELASVITMLASDEASFIFGQDFVIDGGMMA